MSKAQPHPDQPSTPLDRAPAFEPDDALLPGRFDPTALLTTWCLRRSFYPLVWIGIIGAVASGGARDADQFSYDTLGEAVGALLSPLAGLILALGIRLLVAGIGFVLAFRVVWELDAVREPFGTGRAALLPRLLDQVYVARAYRSLRWTEAVRRAAVARLGRIGQRFDTAVQIIRYANYGLFALLIVVLVATG